MIIATLLSIQGGTHSYGGIGGANSYGGGGAQTYGGGRAQTYGGGGAQTYGCGGRGTRGSRWSVGTSISGKFKLFSGCYKFAVIFVTMLTMSLTLYKPKTHLP